MLASSVPSVNDDIGLAPSINNASEQIDNEVSPDAIYILQMCK
jgi:hypothetical protein